MQFNSDVTDFLDSLNHPMRVEIDYLRNLFLQSGLGLSENIKWNGPNFIHEGLDRFTMKIHPSTKIQLILHRGAKVLDQPKNRLVEDPTKLMSWKTNDRAVLTFNNKAEISAQSPELIRICSDWIKASNEHVSR
mgnify:CR=1 FL=1